eukprot:3625376-Heterocapsa_arctica.AAC.1
MQHTDMATAAADTAAVVLPFANGDGKGKGGDKGKCAAGKGKARKGAAGEGKGEGKGAAGVELQFDHLELEDGYYSDEDGNHILHVNGRKYRINANGNHIPDRSAPRSRSRSA